MSLQEEQYFLGKAIVSVNTEAQKNLLIQKLPLLPESYIQRFYPNFNEQTNKPIYCYTASEPADIIW